MNGDTWNIMRAEGGFIVQTSKEANQPSEGGARLSASYESRVFTDSSALLNYLHNELAGSN